MLEKDEEEEKEEQLRLTPAAAAKAHEMRIAALLERASLRRDIERTMGSEFGHNNQKFNVQYEGQSKTDEIENAIDQVRLPPDL